MNTVALNGKNAIVPFEIQTQPHVLYRAVDFSDRFAPVSKQDKLFKSAQTAESSVKIFSHRYPNGGLVQMFKNDGKQWLYVKTVPAMTIK